MKKFEVGKKYGCRSICNNDCIFEFEIIKRTEKTVVIKDTFGKEKRCKIHIENDEEYIYPQGKYSMCPILKGSEVMEETQNIVKREIETQDVEVKAEEKADNVTYVYFQKPDEEVRTELKKRGFKWSSRQGVWQRLLNRNAVYAARQIKELQKRG